MAKTNEELLKQGVDRVNRDKEYETEREIVDLIAQIARQQEIIAQANVCLGKLRAELRQVQLEEVTVKGVLGK